MINNQTGVARSRITKPTRLNRAFDMDAILTPVQGFEMIYLASPYSHPDSEVREQRFQEVCLAAAQLLVAGYAVFSPIVHGHPLVGHGLPTEWPFWERFDRDHLVRCDEVVVLTLDGWLDSAGLAAEIRIAGELGKPVRYLAPDAPDVLPTLAHVATETES